MLICEILIVLVLFDVAAAIEISSDRQSGEWTPRYWVQLMAATGAVVYGLFALWANRELVEDLALGLPPLVVFLILLLPASVVLMTYGATFALGYWSYRQMSSRPRAWRTPARVVRRALMLRSDRLLGEPEVAADAQARYAALRRVVPVDGLAVALWQRQWPVLPLTGS